MQRIAEIEQADLTTESFSEPSVASTAVPGEISISVPESETSHEARDKINTNSLQMNIEDDPRRYSRIRLHLLINAGNKSTEFSDKYANSDLLQGSDFIETMESNVLTSTATTDFGFYLPCPFIEIGCFVRFQGKDIRLWIAHSLSHFSHHLLPIKSNCVFCDLSFESSSPDSNDLLAAWNKRMLHIAQHFMNQHLPIQDVWRPDFFVIEHLYTTGLMSSDIYRYVTNYSERPAHFNYSDLVPLHTRRPTVLTERETRERRHQEAYDLAKEERLLRRQKRILANNVRHTS